MITFPLGGFGFDDEAAILWCLVLVILTCVLV